MIEYSFETPKLDVLNLTFLLKEGGPMNGEKVGILSYFNCLTSYSRTDLQGGLGKKKTSNWS